MDKETGFQYAPLVEQAAETFGQAYFVYRYDAAQFDYVNLAFSQLLGFAPDTVSPSTEAVMERVHPEDRAFLMEQYQRVLEKERQGGIELRLEVPGHQEKWVCLNCIVQKKGLDHYICGYAEDITKRKEYQNNILKFNTKKNSTLEILSHDLAGPFNNIEGMIGLLELELNAPSEVTKDLMAFIKENAKKGSDMIRDFVDNEFLESSQVVLNKERVDIGQRITIMMDNYQKTGYTLLSKRFVTQIPPEAEFVYLDVMKFMQALNNLVSNSLKFTHDDGEITVKLIPQKESVIISVTDNGIGIPDDMKPILFDKFTSARREGLRGEKSVGMGMSIIKNIVELHGGTIWFESQENLGSTFFLEIPRN